MIVALHLDAAARGIDISTYADLKTFAEAEITKYRAWWSADSAKKQAEIVRLEARVAELSR